MTNKEKEVVLKLAEAYTLFDKLPRYHGLETRGFEQAIHVCQTLIMSREAQRNHPELFGPTPKDE